MLKILMSIILVLVVNIAISSAEEPATKENIEGSWSLKEVTTQTGPKIVGEDIVKIKGKIVFSKDGTFEQHALGKKVSAGKYKTDTTTTPAGLDLESTAGESQLGIFKIEGNRLTLVLADVGSRERPKTFEKSRAVEISIYERAKPE